VAPGLRRRVDRATRRFVLEQAILLTLADDEQHGDELTALQAIAARLGGGPQELEETLVEVAAYCEAHRQEAELMGPVSGGLGRLQRLVREGRTVVAVHHDLATAPQYFQEVLLLNVRAIAAGPMAGTFTPENLARTYGGRLSLLEQAVAAAHRDGGRTLA